MGKHTEGPWTVVGPDEHGRMEVQAPGGYVVTPGSDAVADGEPEANVALIAAAPDLLAALEELVARREWLGTEAPVLERARAAIAKATP